MLAGLTTAPSAGAAEPVTHVYVAPDGGAAGDGTRGNPFGSLARANAHLTALAPDTAVQVHLQPGEYLEVGTRWTYHSTHPTTIGADGGIATFNGQDDFADYMVKIIPTTARADMNLTVRNLRFTHATNGLQVKGATDVTLDDLRFDHIGTAFSPVGTGYAALSIQNVDGVVVNRPVFRNLVNVPEQLALVHAIYAANDADNVTVTDVDILRVSGDPLRFRNGSDSFHVLGGTIRNAGEFTAFSEWFDQTRNEARSRDARLVGVSVSGGFDSELQTGRTACFQRFTLVPVDPCYITDLP
ncbi:hypothetical protein ACQBAU_12610 [Propionibacteriaceae bacterium Y2011]|uniref:hypothetical protein n=1 Tax=Microlunatus sp. Y2014 TaxID=3418488 RepID=UPI003B496651